MPMKPSFSMHFTAATPVGSGYSICAGLQQVIEYIENLHFEQDDIDYLRSTGLFEEDFLEYLKNFHFSRRYLCYSGRHSCISP